MTEALLYYLIVINIVTFLIYGIDKWKAKQGSWRISEATLLILAIIGGSIGALLGIRCRRGRETAFPEVQKRRRSIGVPSTRLSISRIPPFYVMGHMFSFFDCNDFSVVSLKCQPERIEDLKAQHDCIGNPYNESPKHWIGINPKTATDDLLQELTKNSYEIVKVKYTKK